MPPIQFSIPLKALSWNKLYSSPHWAIRKRLADEWHLATKIGMMQAHVPHETLSEAVDIEITAYLKRLIDPDNVCAKVIIDGVKRWGLLKDDSPRYVKSVKVVVQKASKNELTEVRIS